MHKIRFVEGGVDGVKSQVEYAETDPSGRFGRFRELLGKGATKRVYRAFDELQGMEVAWNQVELSKVFQSPEGFQRLYSEVHLLAHLRHESIMRFYASWVDGRRRTFNFITEMFTSGTLREYRFKFRSVNIRAVKSWARQILLGLAYLHAQDPPVIHRDLKCDNIFVNGHLGKVKIGDFGLAAVLKSSQHAHAVIGTPEFMAPEVYEEEYNQLVDIYSFGMCVLEMLTSEYPYSECSNPAQIYKKVTSGKLPNAFYRIQDVEAKRFVGSCLEKVSNRLSAQELLLDPFLELDEEKHQSLGASEPAIPKNENLSRTTAMVITATMNPNVEDTVFLRVQISSVLNGEAKNIYFPFDIENDTACDVALEMVKELEIKDWEPSEIATMIEREMSSLLPFWKQQGSFIHDEDEEGEGRGGQEEGEGDGNGTLHPSPPPSHGNTFLGAETGSLKIEDDDATSGSSFKSYKSSGSNSGSVHEDDDGVGGYFQDRSPEGSGEARRGLTAEAQKKSSRLCPTTACDGKRVGGGRKEGRKSQSLLDAQSQLLHRSLVEEIHKRRLYKTVGTIESIGFQDPTAAAGGLQFRG